MTSERIQEGCEVFVSDAGKSFGAVRRVSPHRRPELVVYVENAGDSTVALSAVQAVHAQKVMTGSIIACGRPLDRPMTLRIPTSEAPSAPSFVTT